MEEDAGVASTEITEDPGTVTNAEASCGNISFVRPSKAYVWPNQVFTPRWHGV